MSGNFDIYGDLKDKMKNLEAANKRLTKDNELFLNALVANGMDKNNLPKSKREQAIEAVRNNNGQLSHKALGEIYGYSQPSIHKFNEDIKAGRL